MNPEWKLQILLFSPAVVAQAFSPGPQRQRQSDLLFQDNQDYTEKPNQPNTPLNFNFKTITAELKEMAVLAYLAVVQIKGVV